MSKTTRQQSTTSTPTPQTVSSVVEPQMTDFSTLSHTERVLPINRALSKLSEKDEILIDEATVNIYLKLGLNYSMARELLAMIGVKLNE